MHWLVIAAIALSGCERANETPPAPRDAGPRDAPLDAHVACAPPDAAVRLRALDAWNDHVHTTARNPSPVEAEIRLTTAYADLELAYAYARLPLAMSGC
jgi:hypothetical protein